MPRRKYTDENAEYSSMCNQRNPLYEPITLHIMKEMEVMPLSPLSYTDDLCSEEDSTCIQKPLQELNGQKRRRVVVPEKSPPCRTCSSVLFQKSPLLQQRGENYFLKLSDEIILQIFQWLPKTSLVKCAEVCKHWKELSYDESLWSRFNLGGRYVKTGVLDTLLHKGVSVLRLAMSEIKSPVFVELQFANRQRFSKLQYLDLSMAILSPEALADILAICNKLKKLSLEACTVNESCCRFIAQNKSLEVLNMCMVKGLNESLLGLREIAVNCVKLKEWNLGWTSLDICCMELVLSCLPNSLCRLNISGHQTFNDAALLIVVERCPHLIELDISDCHNVTEESFMALLETCSRLEHLHTSRAYRIPTECNRYLKYMKHFKKLEIFRTLTDEALVQLRQHMPEIKINTEPLSTIARPTTGIKRTSIWGLRVRDS